MRPEAAFEFGSCLHQLLSSQTKQRVQFAADIRGTPAAEQTLRQTSLLAERRQSLCSGSSRHRVSACPRRGTDEAKQASRAGDAAFFALCWSTTFTIPPLQVRSDDVSTAHRDLEPAPGPRKCSLTHVQASTSLPGLRTGLTHSRGSESGLQRGNWLLFWCGCSIGVAPAMPRFESRRGRWAGAVGGGSSFDRLIYLQQLFAIIPHVSVCHHNVECVKPRDCRADGDLAWYRD